MQQRESVSYTDVEIYAQLGSNDAVLIPNVQDEVTIILESSSVDHVTMKGGDKAGKRYHQSPKVKVEFGYSSNNKHVLASILGAATFTGTSAASPIAGVIKGKAGLSNAERVTFYIYPQWVDTTSGITYGSDNVNPDAWKIECFTTGAYEFLYSIAQGIKKLSFDGVNDDDGNAYTHGAGIANPAA